MQRLPKWTLINQPPVLYDFESVTSLQQTARVYAAMQEMIREYNTFADQLNKEMDEFVGSGELEISNFKQAIESRIRCKFEAMDTAFAKLKTELISSSFPYTVRFDEQTLTPEQRAQARKNIDAAVNKMATDEIYFSITADGVISLKPEYRGALPGSNPEAESDNGKGYDGSQNKELPEVIIIPEKVGGIAVTALAKYMFCCNNRVKRVVLPSSIEEIPHSCFYGTLNLEEVLNTESVKMLAHSAFSKSGIRKAYFPNLTGFALKPNGDPSGNHFSNCAKLAVADLGKVFSEPGSNIPKQCFSGCEKLVCLRNAEGVTTIGQFGLFGTRRIENLPFLENLTSIGNYAMLLSRADFAWDELDEDVFGTQSTPYQVNVTDYSELVPQACYTPLRSTFDQNDPRWADKYIVDYMAPTGNRVYNTYSTGCMTIAAAIVYSALMGVDMESPEEFVSAVGKTNSELLKVDIADGVIGTDPNGQKDYEFVELRQWLDAVGLQGVYYDSPSVENVSEMYAALAAGALVIASVPGGAGASTHIVVFHGINKNGELLVTDSDPFSALIGIHEASTYSMPIQNLMRDETGAQNAGLERPDHFLIVTKK